MLRRLNDNGPEGSRRAWWAFEGFTEVDCYLQTEQLILLVEGKRTETLSERVSWLRKRNQLVRNLEAAAALGSHAFVLLAVEHEAAFDLGSLVDDACPHLGIDERTTVAERFIGQVTWAHLCRAAAVDLRSLPEAISVRPMT